MVNSDAEQNNANGNDGNAAGGCRWWQWGCNQQGEEQNGGEQQERGSPWWWMFSGEDAGEDERPSPALVFAYIWSVSLFIFVLLHGSKCVTRGRAHVTIVMLAVFANLAFLSLFFLGGLEGAIEVEGRAIEEHGWYGQFGVMMYMTNSFWLLFSVAFVFIVMLRGNGSEGSSNTSKADQEKVYKMYTEDEEAGQKPKEEQSRKSEKDESWFG